MVARASRGSVASESASDAVRGTAQRYLARQDICVRWQDAMAHLLEQRVPDEGPPRLEEVFRLD
jgi:L-rhamnose mutarotase